jgi:anti-anti-sigma factor
VAPVAAGTGRVIGKNVKATSPGSPEGLGILVADDDGRALYRLSGELDALNSSRLRTLLLEHAGDGRDAVIDLSQLEFIDSSGIGVLVGALKRYEGWGQRLTLRAPTAALRRVFDMTGLTHAFVIEQ